MNKNLIIPQALAYGDKVTVISPSSSGSIISADSVERAVRVLGDMGLVVEFGLHWNVGDDDHPCSIEGKLQDLHAAFADQSCKAVITSIGGFDSNELLSRIDYDLIRRNPKILCGYSDITALQCGILAKTSLVTFSGPHLSTFGMKKGCEYTIESFKAAMFSRDMIKLAPAAAWSDDAWYIDQENRTFIENKGWTVLHEGQAEGRLVGGNLSTLALLSGTPYLPIADGCKHILFIEDDEVSDADIFRRQLVGLIQQPWFDDVAGVLIGRFQNASGVQGRHLEGLRDIILAHHKMPIICNLDFGHTTPQMVMPIGGDCTILAGRGGADIRISLPA